MGSFSIWHWLIVLAIVIMVFGTKKLRSLGIATMLRLEKLLKLLKI